MILEEKQIRLKDGRTAVLKTPCIEDAERLLRYIVRSCGETEFLLRYPEEWEGVTAESEEKWILDKRNAPNALVIACYIDGEIAGNCEIGFMGGIKTAHRAVIGITVGKDCWNLGIGSAMFREMLAAAKANPAIEIAELEVIEGNDRAIALYEKFGFRIVAERPNAFRLKDGSVKKEYFMQKELRQTH